MSAGLAAAPMRQLNRPAPSVEIDRRADGTLLLRSGIAYEPPVDLIPDWMTQAAATFPERTWLAERDGEGWRRLSYRDAERKTAAVATWLIRRGLGAGDTVAILSENSIEHAILNIGVLRAGAISAPVSPAYSTGGDFARFDHVIATLEPKVVFAQSSDRFAPALDRLPAGATVVTVDGVRGVAFADLAAEVDDAAVAARRREIGHDTVAKILFTSGSTGMPKGALNTHGNLVAGQQMIKQVGEPPRPDAPQYVLLDWLPWHHTFGGNAHMSGILRAAGCLYIDDGRPTPDRFHRTIENLRHVSPSGFGSVPACYPMLCDALERDPALRASFFRNIRWLSYGGALLPQDSWERMQRLAVAELGERLPFGCGWGMTETASVGLSVYWNVERTGLLGLPQPGAELKLLPIGDRYELRIKGPHIMPGYHRRPDLNAEAFDEEGWFRTGDAVRWVDAGEPTRGLEFAGRVAEDFKLQSGVWVQASLMRLALLDALQPLVRDLVIVGPDKPWLSALVWLDEAAVAAAGGRSAVAARLAAYNRRPGGSSQHVRRLLALETPPSVADGEVTDKRSINARLVLQRRAADVGALYGAGGDPRLIEPAASSMAAAAGDD